MLLVGFCIAGGIMSPLKKMCIRDRLNGVPREPVTPRTLGEYMCVPFGKIPVSYTQLDVYKRQVSWIASRFAALALLARSNLPAVAPFSAATRISCLLYTSRCV